MNIPKGSAYIRDQPELRRNTSGNNGLDLHPGSITLNKNPKSKTANNTSPHNQLQSQFKIGAKNL
jgi:hypothetical protein